MLTNTLRLGSFVAMSILFVSAGCGGKVSGVVVADKDAGLLEGDDAGGGGGDAIVFRVDSGVPVDDATPVAVCPDPTTVVALDGPCDWEGSCTVALDACDAGDGSLTPTLCEGGVATLPPGEGIACAGHTGGGPDAGTPTPPGGCAIGAACGPEGSTCTNAGAGPCGSDQQLRCRGGVYIPQGFLCSTGPGEGCGFGSTENGCMEQCSCVNGLEVCTGNCPDAGPGSP